MSSYNFRNRESDDDDDDDEEEQSKINKRQEDFRKLCFKFYIFLLCLNEI